MAPQVEPFDDRSVSGGADNLSKSRLGSNQKDLEAQTVDFWVGDHLSFCAVLVDHAEMLERGVAAHENPSSPSIWVAAGITFNRSGPHSFGPPMLPLSMTPAESSVRSIVT